MRLKRDTESKLEQKMGVLKEYVICYLTSVPEHPSFEA